MKLIYISMILLFILTLFSGCELIFADFYKGDIVKNPDETKFLYIHEFDLRTFKYRTSSVVLIDGDWFVQLGSSNYYDKYELEKNWKRYDRVKYVKYLTPPYVIANK